MPAADGPQLLLKQLGRWGRHFSIQLPPPMRPGACQHPYAHVSLAHHVIPRYQSVNWRLALTSGGAWRSGRPSQSAWSSVRPPPLPILASPGCCRTPPPLLPSPCPPFGCVWEYWPAPVPCLTLKAGSREGCPESGEVRQFFCNHCTRWPLTSTGHGGRSAGLRRCNSLALHSTPAGQYCRGLARLRKAPVHP